MKHWVFKECKHVMIWPWNSHLACRVVIASENIVVPCICIVIEGLKFTQLVYNFSLKTEPTVSDAWNVFLPSLFKAKNVLTLYTKVGYAFFVFWILKAKLSLSPFFHQAFNNDCTDIALGNNSYMIVSNWQVCIFLNKNKLVNELSGMNYSLKHSLLSISTGYDIGQNRLQCRTSCS